MTDARSSWHTCLVLHWPGGRVTHWHWPRWDIVHCENSKPENQEES